MPCDKECHVIKPFDASETRKQCVASHMFELVRQTSFLVSNVIFVTDCLLDKCKDYSYCVFVSKRSLPLDSELPKNRITYG